MNKKFNRLYEYCKSQGYSESKSTFEQDLKDLAVEELEGQELSKISGGKKATTALTAGLISALSIASPLASANQVYHSDSSAPYCGITSEKPKSDSKNELRNILIKSGIALAGTGIIGGGIILTAALLKSKLAPKTNNPPEGSSASEKEHDARMGKEDEQKFLQQLLQMANESAQKLKDYYYSLNENSKKEIMGFINENFGKLNPPEPNGFPVYLDSFLLDKFLDIKITDYSDWWRTKYNTTVGSSNYNEIPDILKEYTISASNNVLSDSASNNVLSEYVPIGLVACALEKYEQNSGLVSLLQESQVGKILSELTAQMNTDYAAYYPQDSQSVQVPPQEPVAPSPSYDRGVDAAPSPSPLSSPSPSSSEDEADEPPTELLNSVQLEVSEQPTVEWQKIPDEKLDCYTYCWYTHYLIQSFENCMRIYEQLPPKERGNIPKSTLWDFMTGIFNYFGDKSLNIVNRIDSYDCPSLYDRVKGAFHDHGICSPTLWDFQNENDNPIYRLPRITVGIGDCEHCSILDFNQLRRDFENFGDHSQLENNYRGFYEWLQGTFNDRIERIDQAASQLTVSHNPAQVVTESPQQPLAPASPLPDMEPQQLPDSAQDPQGTSLEEQNPFVDAAPIIEQPLLEFPAITPPLPPTVDQPAQDFSGNDAKFTSPSTPEPHLDSTGDDGSYDPDDEYKLSTDSNDDD